MKKQKEKIDPKPGHFYLLNEDIGQAIAQMDGGLDRIGGIIHFHCVLLALSSRNMEIRIKEGMVQHGRFRPIYRIVREIPIKRLEQMLAEVGLEVRRVFSDNRRLTT